MYYGAFPGEERDVLGAPSSLWVISRPHNWHPNSTQEWLLHLEIDSGKELGRVQVRGGGLGVRAGTCAVAPEAWRRSKATTSQQPCTLQVPHPARCLARLPRLQVSSKFTHDAVRRRDKVYVCNTGEGKVLELALPGMTPVRGCGRCGGQEVGQSKAGRCWGWGLLWAERLVRVKLNKLHNTRLPRCRCASWRCSPQKSTSTRWPPP